MRARLLGLHARARWPTGRDDEATSWPWRRSSSRQKLDLPAVVADATTTLAGIDERCRRPRRGASGRSPRWSSRPTADGDAAGEMRGRYLLGEPAPRARRPGGARASLPPWLRAAAGVGRPWAPYGLEARVMEALVAYELGDWDDALTLTEHGGPSPAGVGEGHAARRSAPTSSPRAATPAPTPCWSRCARSGSATAGSASRPARPRSTLRQPRRRARDAGLLRPGGGADGVTGYFQARIRLTALLLGHLAEAAEHASPTERSRLVARVPELVAQVEAVMARVERRRRPFGPEGLAWLARVHAEHLRLRWLADVRAAAPRRRSWAPGRQR